MKNPEEAEWKDTLKMLGRNSGFRFGGIVIQNLLFLVTALLISKKLGGGVLGSYFLVVTLLNILGFASTLGMKFGTVRYVALFRGRDDLSGVKGTIISSVLISLLAGTIIGVVLFFSSSFLADRVFHSSALRLPFRIIAGALPVFALSTVIISGLQGFKKIRDKVWLENIIQPLSALLFIWLVIAVGGFLSAITAAWCFSLVLMSGCSWFLLSRATPVFRRKTGPRLGIKPLLSFSLPLLAAGLLYYIFTRMDILMLGYFRSSEDVGVYAIAARLAFLIALPLEALNVIFEPTIAESSAATERSSLGRLYQTVTPWVFAIGFPIFVLLIILAPPLLQLFGKNFLAGQAVLLILGIGQLVNISVGSAGSLLSMTGHPRVSLFNTVSMVGLNFGMNCLLIPRYGMNGAAFSTALSIGGINLLRLVEVRNLLRLHPFTVKYGKMFLSALIIGGMVAFIDAILPGGWSAGIRAAVLSGIFVGIYLPALFLIRIVIPSKVIKGL